MAWPKGRSRAGYGCIGIAALPGFAESLRLLLVEEEYTLEDVALMFGVSRERVRQLADARGLTERPKWGGLFCVRIWDDVDHRFRPVHKGVLGKLRQYNKVRANRERRDADWEARRHAAVEAVRFLADAFNRPPTVAELASALGVVTTNPGSLRNILLRPGIPLSIIWTDAGFPMRKPGHRAEELDARD